jgi:mRNA interferase MazF
MRAVRRGEIWSVNLDPTLGREQRGIRPALVVSDDGFNRSGADLVIVAPITTRRRRVRTHVEIRPPDGGLRETSFIMCEQIRALSADRVGSRPFGEVSAPVLRAVEDRLRLLFDL